MRPAAFDPGAALSRQMLAARRARLTWAACERRHPNPGQWALAGAELALGWIASPELTITEDLRTREAERRARGLHTLLSYPDSQQFEDFCRACPSVPTELLFDQLIEEMRTTRVSLAAAVRSLVCRVLALTDGGYDDFVKLLKAYNTLSRGVVVPKYSMPPA